ncbi:cation transporter, partial [Morganella morganii]
MANTTILALQGLSCGHCTASVKKALDARPDVESAVVTLDFAKVT